jgi:nickel superoxide dismutase
MAQYAAISVLRLIDLIDEMPDNPSSKSDIAKLARLVEQKEEHAHKVKEEVTTIWGDYFKQPQIEKYPDVHNLAHSIMMAASKCKQELARENGEELLNKVNKFAEMFWLSKEVEVEVVTSKNLPHVDIVVPKN